jgi:hypothetical protein
MIESLEPDESWLEIMGEIFADYGDIFPFPTRHLMKLLWEINRTAIARWELDSKMDAVNRSYNKVRNELCEVGLLAEEVYLDSIELEVHPLPNYGEAGYVFEQVPWHLRLLWREGVIYLPGDIPDLNTYIPGGSLIDTIRHEYAHAWHWMEPDYFERPWYEKAFSIPYDDLDIPPLQLWLERKQRNREFRKAIKACRTELQAENLLSRELRNDFVSEYATTLSREDFAETFMIYLKHRNSLGKFKSRPGVYKKLLAVERAVNTARRELGL